MILLRRPGRRRSQDALLWPGSPGSPPGWQWGDHRGPAGYSPQLPLIELAVLRLHLVDLLLEPLDLQRDRDGSPHLPVLRLLHGPALVCRLRPTGCLMFWLRFTELIIDADTGGGGCGCVELYIVPMLSGQISTYSNRLIRHHSLLPGPTIPADSLTPVTRSQQTRDQS